MSRSMVSILYTRVGALTAVKCSNQRRFQYVKKELVGPNLFLEFIFNKKIAFQEVGGRECHNKNRQGKSPFLKFTFSFYFENLE